MKIFRQRFFFVGYVAIIAAGFLSWYIHRTIISTRAAADNVTITFTPIAGTFAPGAQQDIDVLIQTADGAKKISGIDITFNAGGPIRLVNATDPVPFPGTDTGLFTQVMRSVSDSKVRLSYISLKPSLELPSVIKIRLTFQTTGEGVGTVLVDQVATQIVGNIAEKEYGIDRADEGIYTISQGNVQHTVSARIDPPSVQVPVQNTQDYSTSISITDVPDGKKVSAYQFRIQYDPTLIEVVSVDPPFDAATGADANKFTMLRNTINASTGIIDLAYIISLPDASLPARPKQIIHLRGKQAGNGEMRIISSQVTGNIPEGGYLVNVYNGTYQVVNVGPSVVVSATPTPSPYSPTYQPTPTQPPTGVCNTDYDCLESQICSSNSCVNLPCNDVYASCIRTVPRNHGCAIEYAPDGYLCENNGVCQNGICNLNSTITPTISPIPTSTSIPVPTVSQYPFPSLSPSPIPSPTPTTASNIGNITLNLRLKFQGIMKLAGGSTTMKVKVSLDGPGQNDIQSQLVDFNSDVFGFWSGTASFNAPAGGGYKVYIKGAQHLQKRICDAAPAETASGTYRCGDTGKIVLQSGVNNLDFSGIIQLSGDLPAQDGVVDAYDIAYIRLNLGSTDPKALSVADINRDGILDTQDYSLLVASLNVKYDEL